MAERNCNALRARYELTYFAPASAERPARRLAQCLVCQALMGLVDDAPHRSCEILAIQRLAQQLYTL